MVASQLTTDYKGNDYTASLTVANPSIFTNSGVIVGQYLQSITSSIALGAELAYQFGPNVPGRQIAIVSAVGRYSSGNSVWSGTLGQNGMHLCYYQKASDQLQIGVEVETSLRMQESVATLAYQIDLPKADLIFRGNWHCFDVNDLFISSSDFQEELIPTGTSLECWRSGCSHCHSRWP